MTKPLFFNNQFLFLTIQLNQIGDKKFPNIHHTTFNFQLRSRVIPIKKKPPSPNHQTIKSPNLIAAPFLLKWNPISTSAHQHISTSFRNHLSGKMFLLRLHNHQINPMSFSLHRKISGIVPVMNSQWFLVNDFTLQVINQQLACFPF